MSWKDRLVPASFRGARFLVNEIDMQFGRRNQLHEYPLRDEPYAEDLGKKAREYTVNAYIIGKDYFSQRDALISAIEQNDTPGTLIHPTLGSITVIPKDCRVVYNNAEGGLEKFVLTFAESGSNFFPSGSFGLQSSVRTNAKNAQTVVKKTLLNIFVTTGYPSFVADAAISVANDFAVIISKAATRGVPENEQYSNFQKSLIDYANDITVEISNADILSDRTVALVTDLTSLYTDYNDALIAQKYLVNFGNNYKSVSAITPSRTQQNINQSLFVYMIKSASLCELMRITSLLDYESRQDALKILEDITTLVDAHLLLLGDLQLDDDFFALSKVRAATVKDIQTRGARLPELLYIQTFDSVPALNFAYEQYEDASRDAKIVARNKIRNPVFVPANSLIEIVR